MTTERIFNLPHARFALALAAIALVALAAGCGRDEALEWDAASGATPTHTEFETLRADRNIMIHCGASMRPAVETLAMEFQKRTGIGVRFNFGGSAELLAAVELGGEGDLYIPHDPYAARLAEKGLLDRYEAVGHLWPVILVAPGNPLGIASIDDLAREGLRVGLPDARFATAGKLIRDELARRGLTEAVEANLRLETRAHSELALALTSGHLDVAMAWSFIPRLYEGKLDAIEAGIDWPEIRVTAILLKSAADREAAERFLTLAKSEWGREVFTRYGYAKPTP